MRPFFDDGFKATRIRIVIQSDGSDDLPYGRGQFGALQISRLLCDLQHLAFFAMAIAGDHLPQADQLFDRLYQKYESMVMADIRIGLSKPYPFELDGQLWIESIRYGSPFDIIVALVHSVELEERIRAIWNVLRRIIMLDLAREKYVAEIDALNEQAKLHRQQALGQALANYEQALRIERRIPNSQMRERFIENFETAIAPFIDGRYPTINTFKIAVDTKAPNRTRRKKR